jgi:hypothetical protein
MTLWFHVGSHCRRVGEPDRSAYAVTFTAQTQITPVTSPEAAVSAQIVKDVKSGYSK